MPSDTVVLVTARNEADRIAGTLAALRLAFPGAPVIVADDASTDATPDIARAADGVELVRAPSRQGKGGAATLGAHRALEADGAAVVVLCDADLGESARHLPWLVEAIGPTDLAIARFATRVGGGFGLALTAASSAIEQASGRRFEAPLSGQRAMRPRVLERLLPFADGFGMETAMTLDALRAGLEVAEIELPLEHRATGRTPAGFLHRARQLRDIQRAVRKRAVTERAEPGTNTP